VPPPPAPRQVPPLTEEEVGGAMGTFTMWSTADGGMEYMLEVSGAPGWGWPLHPPYMPARRCQPPN
jgi:hypothetical protein